MTVAHQAELPHSGAVKFECDMVPLEAATCRMMVRTSCQQVGRVLVVEQYALPVSKGSLQLQQRANM